MAKFILGYNNPEDEILTLYKSTQEADYKAEEWCIVEADNIQQAIDKYEETFTEWQNNNPLQLYPECKCNNSLEFSNCSNKCERNVKLF